MTPGAMFMTFLSVCPSRSCSGADCVVPTDHRGDLVLRLGVRGRVRPHLVQTMRHTQFRGRGARSAPHAVLLFITVVPLVVYFVLIGRRLMRG